MKKVKELMLIAHRARLDCIIGTRYDPLQERATNAADASEDNETDDEDLSLSCIRDSLRTFLHDDTSSWMMTPVLPRPLRRDVRAWARLHNFAHTTQVNSDATERYTLIHKDKTALPRRPKNGETANKAPSTDGLTKESSKGNTLTSSNSSMCRKNSSLKASVSCYDLPGYMSGGSNHSFTPSFSQAGTTSKKTRLPKDENGYICVCPGCLKTFDRACDLTHHQRSHRPKDTRPYKCDSCEKRFQYPKDCRRHERTHQRTALPLDNFEESVSLKYATVLMCIKANRCDSDRGAILRFNQRLDRSRNTTREVS